MKLTEKMTNILRPVARWMGYIAAVALVGLMLITVVDVLLRFFFNRPLLGTIEVTEYLMVVLSFLAIATCAFDDGHVGVDMVILLLNEKKQACLQVIGYLLCLVMFVPLSIFFVPEVIGVWQAGERSEILNIPAAPFYAVAVVGCIMVTLVLIIQLMNSINKVRGK